MNKISHDSEIAAKGKQVITACAFIHHVIDGQQKLFMPKRADTKKFLPGVYELPGGHIDFGEDLVDGLKREIKEEFGMDIEVGDPFFTFAYTNDIKGSHSNEVVYFSRFTNDINNIAADPEDHSEFNWYSELELPKAYTPTKGEKDIEFIAARKGFSILNGEPLITL